MYKIVLSLLVVVLLVVVSNLVQAHNSLVQAVNELHTCEQSGGIDCHIEQDGLNYNVYGKEM